MTKEYCYHFLSNPFGIYYRFSCLLDLRRLLISKDVGDDKVYKIKNDNRPNILGKICRIENR